MSFINRRIAYALTLIAVFNVSWASIFIRLANAPGVVCATWRLIFSTIITWSILILSNRLRDLLSLNKKIILLAVISGVSLAVHFATWMESLFLLSVAVSVTLVVTYPLVTALIEHFILKEKIKIIQWIGITIAFIGVSTLSFSTIINDDSVSYASNNVLGVVLALVGALTAAIYFVIGRIIRQKTSMITYTSITYTSASIVLLLTSISLRYNLVEYDTSTWLYFVLLAVVPMLGGHSVLNYLLKYIKASIITATVLGEPVGASILAAIILGEILPIQSYICIAITLIGIFIVLYFK